LRTIKTREISSKSPNNILHALRKTRTSQAQKQLINIGAEINEHEFKRVIQKKINEMKRRPFEKTNFDKDFAKPKKTKKKLNKIIDEKRYLNKYSGNTSKTYIPINWEI
jgi:hypothetical protein